MPKVKLIATGKKYGTRHMMAGEPLSVKPMEARVLKALGVAKDAPVERTSVMVDFQRGERVDLWRPQAQQPPATDHQPVDDLAVLRDEYERIAGKRADMRWGAARLQEEIAAAKDSED